MGKIMLCPGSGHGGENPDDTPSGSVNWDNSGGDFTTQCDCACEGCCCDNNVHIIWGVAGHGYDLTFTYDADGRGDDAMRLCLGFTEIITDAYVYFDDCPEFTDGSDADLHFNFYTDGFPEPPYVIPDAANYDCVTVILTDQYKNVLNRCTAKLVKNDPECGDPALCCDLIDSSFTGGCTVIDFAQDFVDCLDDTVLLADIFMDIHFEACYPDGEYQLTATAADLPLSIPGSFTETCVCIVFYVEDGAGYRILGYCGFDGTQIF